VQDGRNRALERTTVGVKTEEGKPAAENESFCHLSNGERKRGLEVLLQKIFQSLSCDVRHRVQTIYCVKLPVMHATVHPQRAESLYAFLRNLK
jgi:hypothetical protein